MITRNGFVILPLVCIPLFLGGCDLNIKDDGVARAEARINGSDLIIAGAKDTTIAFEDQWIQQDYSLFRGRHLLAEFIYTTTDPEKAVLEMPLDFDAALQTWNLSRTHPLAMTGAMGRIDRIGQSIFYQPYALTDLGWGCVAMKSEWDTAPKDIGPRPAKAIFGYVCNTGGGLGAVRAEQIASRFFVSKDAADLAAIPIAAPAAAPLLAEARRGARKGESGNPEFPLRIGRAMIDITIIADGEGGVVGGW